MKHSEEPGFMQEGTTTSTTTTTDNDIDPPSAPHSQCYGSFPAPAFPESAEQFGSQAQEMDSRTEQRDMELPGARSLAAFCADEATEPKFTDDLKQIVEVIACTGKYWHDWSMLKCLLSFRLKQVLAQYFELHITAGGWKKLVSGEPFADFQRRLLETLDSFTHEPPFTLQRFCELLLNPRKTYPSIDKLALAYEKLLYVTSTIPICKDPYPSSQGNDDLDICNKVQDQGQPSIHSEQKSCPENVDLEMMDTVIENKHANTEKPPPTTEEDSPTLDKLQKESNGQEMEGIVESPLVDDDLVDIPLDEHKSGGT